MRAEEMSTSLTTGGWQCKPGAHFISALGQFYRLFGFRHLSSSFPACSTSLPLAWSSWRQRSAGSELCWAGLTSLRRRHKRMPIQATAGPANCPDRCAQPCSGVL